MEAISSKIRLVIAFRRNESEVTIDRQAKAQELGILLTESLGVETDTIKIFSPAFKGACQPWRTPDSTISDLSTLPSRMS